VIGNCQLGCTYYVQFAGIPGAATALTVTAALSGGMTGSSPTIVTGYYMHGGNSAFLDPIPGEILFTAHDYPQV